VKTTQAFRARARGEQTVEIDIYDVIGADPLFGGGVSALAVLDSIRPVKAGGRIECRINSVGGLVIEGLAIYNDLTRKRDEGVDVVCRVDALAGSIASVIAMAGRTEMAEHSFLMLHNPYGFVEGEADDLRDQADTLDKMREQLLNIYAKKAPGNRELFNAMLSKGKDNYLTALEARAYGLCDAVIPDAQAKLVAHFDMARLKNAPAAVLALAEKIGGAPTVTPVADATTEEVTRNDLRIPSASAETITIPSDGDAALTNEPPAPAAPIGEIPMSMTPEELQKMNDLEAQVTTLSAALDAEKGARAEAEGALAKSKKASDDEDEDDEDEMAKAEVVAEAIQITGCKDLAKLPGALVAVGERMKNAGSVKDTHAARVKRLIAEGKLPPHMKAKAMAWTPAKLDGFLEITGGEKFAPVSEEHEPGTEDPKVVAAVAVGKTPIFNAAAIQLSPEELKVCKGMSTDPDKYLAEKREEAERAHRQKYGSAA
jgi:ATP-dependent protease ClpP protease subunit